MLKVWIAAIGFLGVLSVGSAQETGAPHATPNAASVVASESLRLVPGQSHSFRLQFNCAPEGYGGGKIKYRFQRVVPPYPWMGMSAKNDEVDAEGEIELHDGQAIYLLPLTIKYSMSPGTWKLVEVTIGRINMKPVTISDNITFEIPRIAIMLHIQAPKVVMAGQHPPFKITLDEYPKEFDPECRYSLQVSLHPVRSDGKPVEKDFTVQASSPVLKLDQHLYEISGSFDSDLPNGPWQGEVSVVQQRGRGGWVKPCRPLTIEGDAQFSFTVEPAAGRVTPTSVVVTINPSQIQLLEAEADRLKAKAYSLKQQLNSENMAANQLLLQNSVQEAIADLNRTKANYKQKGLDQPIEPAVDIFFDDIRLSYMEARKILPSHSAQVFQTAPRLKYVNAALVGTSSHLDPASQALIESIRHNASAYDIAASSKALTFNLDVYSEPKGAAISYKLRNDSYHPLDHETDWKIENLPRAHYFILLQKPGYENKEVEFDAIDSPRTSIEVQLIKSKRGAR